MPLLISDYIFQTATYNEWENSYYPLIISTTVSHPTTWDALRIFQGAYPIYINNMQLAFDDFDGELCILISKTVGGTEENYFKLISGDVRITDVVYNTTPLKQVIDGSTVAWAKSTASFSIPAGWSPSSYTAVTKLDDEIIYSPGSPSRYAYTFDGWTPSLPGYINQDTTFTLKFKYNPSYEVYLDGIGAYKLVYYVYNPCPYDIRVYYQAGNSTPRTTYVDVYSGDEAYFTINTSPNTSYYVYHQAQVDGVFYNSSSYNYDTTPPLPVTPTIYEYGKTQTSFDYQIGNNQSATMAMTFGSSTNPTTTVFAQLPGNTISDTKTVTGLSPNTTYRYYARSRSSYGDYSANTYRDFKTYENLTAPTITYVRKDSSSITYTVKNNNTFNVDIFADKGTSTPTHKVVSNLAANTTSGEIKMQSLSASTQYTIYARSGAFSNYSSSNSITQTTTASLPKRATPTVNAATCIILGGTNRFTIGVKNNDASTVTLTINGTPYTGIAAGATKTVSLSIGGSTPYSYNITATAIASGKDNSLPNTRSGTVTFCTPMN